MSSCAAVAGSQHLILLVPGRETFTRTQSDTASREEIFNHKFWFFVWSNARRQRNGRSAGPRLSIPRKWPAGAYSVLSEWLKHSVGQTLEPSWPG